MGKLKGHRITLRGKTAQGQNIELRPMTEGDWDILARWNNDPDVLYYAEGDDVTSRKLEEVQDMYRSVSHQAFCFIIELDGKPIGEGWLQRMNLKRILQRYPGLDCRRIDLTIGEKEYWGKRVGTEAIRLLTEFGFLEQGADMIFGCDIADYNLRSLRVFQKAGYKIVARIEQPTGRKANYVQDVALTRQSFLKQRQRKR